jgi:ABC-type sugar transport system ATPase subunit
LTEPVGPVTYVDLALGDRSLRASVDGTRRYQIGEDVAVAFRAEQLHFFDAATGERIASPT